MKKILILLLPVSVWLIQGPSVPPQEKQERKVAITDKILESYLAAQKKTEEARQAVESSPVWKDYTIAQTRERVALFYVLAETGLKPSDGCEIVLEADAKGKIIGHFECGKKPVEQPPVIKP